MEKAEEGDNLEQTLPSTLILNLNDGCLEQIRNHLHFRHQRNRFSRSENERIKWKE